MWTSGYDFPRYKLGYSCLNPKNFFFSLGFVWEFIREWNNYKGIEMNRIEWNIFKQDKWMKKKGIK